MKKLNLNPAKIAEALGADYYTENGKVIFTRSYLLRRGWCCNNNCKHCPYQDGYAETKTPEG